MVLWEPSLGLTVCCCLRGPYPWGSEKLCWKSLPPSAGGCVPGLWGRGLYLQSTCDPGPHGPPVATLQEVGPAPSPREATEAGHGVLEDSPVTVTAPHVPTCEGTEPFAYSVLSLCFHRHRAWLGQAEGPAQGHPAGGVCRIVS